MADMLVILNDNDMSISPPVGALNRYFARLMSGKFYSKAREGAKSVLKNTPLYEFARRFEEHTKGMVVPGTIFEEFGLNYVGPIDGHDLDSLIPTLENLRDAKAAVPARGHEKGHGLQARRGRPGQLPRPRASSTSPSACRSPPRRPSRPSPKCSARGCATWPKRTSA
jgi:Deoxyxylulose-5-phosphate synthase